MSLPREIRERLAKEFRFVAQKIEEAPDIPAKLYFFSALYGEAGRALNLAWDDQLALIHLVCQATYERLNGRVQLVASGADRVVGIPNGIPEALPEIARALAGLFDATELDTQGLQTTLSRLATIGFATTGNGAYLYIKGHLRISAPTVL